MSDPHQRYQPLHRPLVVKPRGISRVAPTVRKEPIADAPAAKSTPIVQGHGKVAKKQQHLSSYHAKRIGGAVGRAYMIEDIMSRSMSSQSSRWHLSLKRPTTRQALAYVIAGLILIATGYVSVDTWLVNRRVVAETSLPTSNDDVSQSSDSTKASTSSSDAPQFSDGIDTKKPTVDILKNYKVADDAPRALYITKIGVRARVLSMGIASDGSIATPKNIYDSGWYDGSSKPGLPGAMIIDGHASGSTRVGLFAYLDKLAEGDKITVEKGDGTKLDYKVVHKDIVPKDEVNMSAFLQPYSGVSEGLNMITCTGKWIESQQTLDHRVLIFAERV